MQMVILQSVHRWVEVRNGVRPCTFCCLWNRPVMSGPQARWVLMPSGQFYLLSWKGRRNALPKARETDGQKLITRGGSERIYRMFSLANRTEQAGKQFASVQVLRDTHPKKSRRNKILTLVGDKETACG